MGGSYLSPRGFAEPLPLAGLSPLSGSRSSASAAAAAAPCPPVTQETASSSLPPTNQHRSHGASQPMGDLAILVPFQGPKPFPKLGDQRGRQGSLWSCCSSKVCPRGEGDRESHLVPPVGTLLWDRHT